MKYGYIKTAAVTPDVLVADPLFNGKMVRESMTKAAAEQVKLIVFPELCLSSATCGVLFTQDVLLDQVMDELVLIKECSKEQEMLTVVGAPLFLMGQLYNCAVVIYKGSVLGIVPKANAAEWFAKGAKDAEWISFLGETVPFGCNILFQCAAMRNFTFACEIGDDVWAPVSPAASHALAGATVIAAPAATFETATKGDYRRNLLAVQSGKLAAAYVYAEAGEGESTTDFIFGGQNLICENGTVLSEGKRFENGMIIGDIDVNLLAGERRKNAGFKNNSNEYYDVVEFVMAKEETPLTRTFSKTPFIPEDKEERARRCEEILTMQALGLKKRLSHARAQTAVIGISGGLDSTLALLVTARAFDMLGMPREKMICVTMPCFGTTDRTYQNALTMTKELGATLREVNIMKAVTQHFEDIGHDMNVRNVAYENAQARERTQVIMDIANDNNGMVIGTGDLSELALGWATYNGDHMSMYCVNGDVPKMLVRHIVTYAAEMTEQEGLKRSLLDVVDTPVSPELLPPVDGEIAQKTEDLVGPYELHDFFLYYMLRFGFTPKKIFRIALQTFEGEYDQFVIYKWLRTFCWRFFAQQYKRSCLPDGPKVGSVDISPRGSFKMGSDVSSAAWMKQMDELKEELGIE
ncbi:MAG: NAD(+) synthase [Lachnospiraceae bacterium]|nr:NAD(+) synthase [Lachnospiraceae bacterium]